MSPRTPWSYVAGTGKARVVVYEDARYGTLTLRWWDQKKNPPNWAKMSLRQKIEVDARGKITTECEAFAVAAAQQKSLDLAGGVTSAAVQAPAKFTIGQTEAAITNKDTGKYPRRTQMVDELRRSLRLAVALWGADTPWESITDAHWTMLLRRRLEGLVAEGHKGDRATEITIGRLITAVRWLRKKKLIPRDAAYWSDDWKDDVEQHWMAVNKSDRPPEPFRPRHTHEEAIAILGASGFDPRFMLLMWLGMELRLGQVARARRTDLELPPVDFAAPVERDEDGIDLTDYGTFEVFGAGKKHGTVVDLTRGQRRILDWSLADGGYLGNIERRFKVGEVGNYRLFPSGYVVGRVGLLREKPTQLSLSDKVNFERAVTGSWIRKNFRTAEKRAGVTHIPGRSAYGVRRVSRDVAEGMSQSAIENFGSWTAGSKVANEVYLEPTNKAGRREARGARARLRGETV